MFFLIEYERSNGRLMTLKAFAESQRKQAEDARLELELKLHRQGIEYEVVILEAASEAAIRRTHRRYFEDLAQLATMPELAVVP